MVTLMGEQHPSSSIDDRLIIYRLLVASEYEPFSIVERLSPYLAGSASIVVHSPHIQVRFILLDVWVS